MKTNRSCLYVVSLIILLSVSPSVFSQELGRDYIDLGSISRFSKFLSQANENFFIVGQYIKSKTPAKFIPVYDSYDSNFNKLGSYRQQVFPGFVKICSTQNTFNMINYHRDKKNELTLEIIGLPELKSQRYEDIGSLEGSTQCGLMNDSNTIIISEKGIGFITNLHNKESIPVSMIFEENENLYKLRIASDSSQAILISKVKLSKQIEKLIVRIIGIDGKILKMAWTNLDSDFICVNPFIAFNGTDVFLFSTLQKSGTDYIFSKQISDLNGPTLIEEASSYLNKTNQTPLSKFGNNKSQDIRVSQRNNSETLDIRRTGYNLVNLSVTESGIICVFEKYIHKTKSVTDIETHVKKTVTTFQAQSVYSVFSDFNGKMITSHYTPITSKPNSIYTPVSSSRMEQDYYVTFINQTNSIIDIKHTHTGNLISTKDIKFQFPISQDDAVEYDIANSYYWYKNTYLRIGENRIKRTNSKPKRIITKYALKFRS